MAAEEGVDAVDAVDVAGDWNLVSCEPRLPRLPLWATGAAEREEVFNARGPSLYASCPKAHR